MGFLLEAVILKALEKDPKRRYQSVGEMLSDLKRAREILENPKTLNLEGAFRGIKYRFVQHRLLIAISILLFG
ncbi:MAG: hypothetical protein D6822_02535, partial [Cyanobacteria bacterium J149]